MNKKTVIIGASDNPERYAYKATLALQKHGHEAIPVGLRPGQINGTEITKEKTLFNDVDTVTLYVGPQNQESWKEYVINLKPKRVIFNPGTENPKFEAELQKKGIETIEACTLVMLSIGNY
ncbi:MAG: CoA-binding protein [Bacteroidia bacterium]|nr:CoA-binding protein [Bacteroidia bacterium]MCK6648990.1 CoA-binding protein [Bacteroidia bacterium]